MWARLGIKFWVELFKEHVRTRGKASLPEATRSGFQRSHARYLDRVSRAAFEPFAPRSTAVLTILTIASLRCAGIF